MNHDHHDRMAPTRKRGPRVPPPPADWQEPPADAPSPPAAESPEMPSSNEARCLRCGIRVRLRREVQRGDKSYATCPRCGARMLMVHGSQGWSPARLV